MISVVVPALNEEKGLRELYRRVVEAARSWPAPLEELVLVDDGSTDRTLQVAREIARGDARFKIVSLTRNFGHQAAVSAGLEHASGDVVVILDADLQDPPESVGPLIAKLEEGFDVVYAVRTKRKEGAAKRAAYFLYYRLLKRLAALDIPLDTGDFCVMRREVARAICSLPESARFVRGLRTWVGYRQVGVAYERGVRHADETKYTLGRLIRLGLDGIVSFSAKPLRAAMWCGLMVGALSVALSLVVLVQYVFNVTIVGYNPRDVPGWTTLMLVLLLSSATQLFSIGVLSEYVGRLFEESKRRPLYLVRERVNFPASGADGSQAAPRD